MSEVVAPQWPSVEHRVDPSSSSSGDLGREDDPLVGRHDGMGLDRAEVIRCMCETDGWCVLCGGLAAAMLDAGAEVVLIDSEECVWEIRR